MSKPDAAPDDARPDEAAPCAEVPADGPVRLGWLGDAIGYNLRLAQDASFQAFSALAGETGLRPGRYALMQLIGDNPGIGQTALSAAVGRDKSTLTPLLNDLERRGLIARAPDPHDRRGRRIALTAAGRAKLAQLAACAARHDARLNAVFAPDERAQFLNHLKRLTEALTRDASPVAPSRPADED
ncbi:MarR family winged helix-turn-helix transcriptional regulator [Methylobacterium nonmethylotrophicum]|uniref:MarR family transcriptional regulator n=1 Tax=Methylobacterium nonmethylotrophicum TaxID=1141884 RepID=A0A4Z0NH75_9HYPH|nr:MarR family winged helix-turn-helix transcriptional regulator [Methylobacterium nonmethylotrophicum]TGD94787.1 MarR family transcriptional regulator [Methylobacterium nonmethylotrophicum]